MSNEIQVKGKQEYESVYFENMKNYKDQITQLLNEYEVSYYADHVVGNYNVDIFIPILGVLVSFCVCNKQKHEYITTMTQCEHYIVISDNSLDKALCKIMTKIINNIHIIQLAKDMSYDLTIEEKMLTYNTYYRYVILPMKKTIELQKRIIGLCNINNYHKNKSDSNIVSHLRSRNKKFKIVPNKSQNDDMTVYDGNTEDLRTLTKTNKYMGYVYILEWNNMVKIGYTTNPYQRYNDLKSHAENYGNVYIGKFALSREHTNYKNNECKLHRHFKKYRKQGTELFNITIEQALLEIPKIISFLNETKKLKEEDDMCLKFAKSFFSDWRK